VARCVEWREGRICGVGRIGDVGAAGEGVRRCVEGCAGDADGGDGSISFSFRFRYRLPLLVKDSEKHTSINE
jgi:hypothetical protein